MSWRVFPERVPSVTLASEAGQAMRPDSARKIIQNGLTEGVIFLPPKSASEAKNVLDGRKSGAASPALDGRQKREPNIRGARPRSDAKCGDRQGSSIGAGGTRQELVGRHPG